MTLKIQGSEYIPSNSGTFYSVSYRSKTKEGGEGWMFQSYQHKGLVKKGASHISRIKRIRSLYQQDIFTLVECHLKQRLLIKKQKLETKIKVLKSWFFY